MRALLVGGSSTDFPHHNDFIENGQRKGMFLGYDVAPTRLSLATKMWHVSHCPFGTAQNHCPNDDSFKKLLVTEIRQEYGEQCV